MTDTPTQRNIRVQARYDELMHEGKHGHYETLFRVVREEVGYVAIRAEEAEAAYQDTIEKLQAVCEKHRCQAGMNRFDWIDHQLTALAEARTVIDNTNTFLERMISLLPRQGKHWERIMHAEVAASDARAWLAEQDKPE